MQTSNIGIPTVIIYNTKIDVVHFQYTFYIHIFHIFYIFFSSIYYFRYIVIYLVHLHTWQTISNPSATGNIFRAICIRVIEKIVFTTTHTTHNIDTVILCIYRILSNLDDFYFFFFKFIGLYTICNGYNKHIMCEKNIHSRRGEVMR